MRRATKRAAIITKSDGATALAELLHPKTHEAPLAEHVVSPPMPVVGSTGALPATQDDEHEVLTPEPHGVVPF